MMGHRQVEQAALFYEFCSNGTFRPITCCARSMRQFYKQVMQFPIDSERAFLLK